MVQSTLSILMCKSLNRYQTVNKVYDLEIPWSKVHLLSKECIDDKTIRLDKEKASKCVLAGGESFHVQVIGRVPDINWRVNRDFKEKMARKIKQ